MDKRDRDERKSAPAATAGEKSEGSIGVNTEVPGTFLERVAPVFFLLGHSTNPLQHRMRTNVTALDFGLFAALSFPFLESCCFFWFFLFFTLSFSLPFFLCRHPHA